MPATHRPSLEATSALKRANLAIQIPKSELRGPNAGILPPGGA
jgi:hypothetical protein